MHRGQYPGRSPFRHSRGVFLKDHLPAIMQAGFNQPMLASDLHHPLGRGFFAGQAGDAVFYCLAGLDHFLPRRTIFVYSLRNFEKAI